jgi:16S rRNA (guanine527-N7)-methyltransferase
VTVTDLDRVLERSRSLGFLGPGSVRVHVEHAEGFAAGVPAAPGTLLDLGSGGGVPGLVLARRWPGCEIVLLDAGERRCEFLRSAVRDLRLDDRVRVVRDRAEEAGRAPELRGHFDVVVARGFGPPAVTAECGAPFLRVGGRLVVSDPPREGDGEPGGGDGLRAGADATRWPPAGLARLGLVAERAWRRPFHYQALRQQQPCPDGYPRRNGVPARRPLF